MFNKAHRIAFFFLLTVFSTSLVVQAYSGAGSSGDQGLLQTIASHLTTPVVSTVLLTIGVLGFLIELITMCSLAGGIGIAAMFFFFASFLILDPTKWWVAIIFVVGTIFLIAEVFFLPGHGVSGLIGLVCTYVSIFLIMPNMTQAAVSFVSSILIAGVIFAATLKYLPKSPVWNKFRLQTTMSEEEGYIPTKKKSELVGALGVAMTDLRPSGVAMINENRIDVTTNGGYIQKDTPIRVVKAEGIRVVVETVEQGW